MGWVTIKIILLARKKIENPPLQGCLPASCSQMDRKQAQTPLVQLAQSPTEVTLALGRSFLGASNHLKTKLFKMNVPARSGSKVPRATSYPKKWQFQNPVNFRSRTAALAWERNPSSSSPGCLPKVADSSLSILAQEETGR